MKKHSKRQLKWIELFNKEQLKDYPELADGNNTTTLGEYKDSWTYEISLEYYLKGREDQFKKSWLAVFWEVFSTIVIALLIGIVLSQSYIISKQKDTIDTYETAIVQYVIENTK